MNEQAKINKTVLELIVQGVRSFLGTEVPPTASHLKCSTPLDCKSSKITGFAYISGHRSYF